MFSRTGFKPGTAVFCVGVNTDHCGNKTLYEYDVAGRTTKVISKDSSDNEHSYDSVDNMSEIVRGDGMKYMLAYNEFCKLKLLETYA